MILSKLDVLFMTILGLLLHFVSGTLALTAAEIVAQHVEYKTQGYLVLESRQFSGYSIRMKEPKLCEAGGAQYSGYIDKHDTNDHFYFYFVESKNNPVKDPTVLWLNGGPGCSSMMIGNWINIGPCKVNAFGNDIVPNPYSWNNAANLIFLDQPVETGYSYGDTKIRTTEEAAQDAYAFLQIFFFHFKKYAMGPFHISTFSYGGHFGPSLSAEIIRHNRKIKEHDRGKKDGDHHESYFHSHNSKHSNDTSSHNYITTNNAEELIHINFESLMLSNGWTNAAVQFKEFSTFACTADPLAKKENIGLYRPFANATTCDSMKQSYKQCKTLLDTCSKNAKAAVNTTNAACVSAMSYCQSTLGNVVKVTGMNAYDLRKKCVGDPNYCYEEYTNSETYGNLPHVKADLGVDKEAVDRFSICSDTIETNFYLSGDYAFEHSTDIAFALNSGIRVLVYVGDMDWVGNWVANLAYLTEMDWFGKEEFDAAPFIKWYTAGKTEAGRMKKAKNLTFLKVYDAGHMVPFDHPKNSLDLFTKWITNKRL
ncbi:Alpha/Beta hydrolase protein [Mycotypha africana]|uniref:Alpha/Beta hydrolase protein n=1 Tax=Mycotypha africana TaxID=64632 RepID=UPI0022FFEC29|nr:Alpha/Beta hydrolase protein [Mycotypha africana]KAI8988023.1 Alpha/Beta hydrolase protein [Mycotypha africana]